MDVHRFMLSETDRMQAQKLDRHGIFAHPSENVGEFITDGYRILSSTSSTMPNHLHQTMQQHFEIDGRWVPIEESDQFLLPWEVACCIIEDDGKPSIYIRPNGVRKQMIGSEVVLAHELIHAFRSRLQSKIFEEHIAFAAAQMLFPKQISSLRTWSGPLFTKPFEIVITCALLCGASMLPWFSTPPILLGLVGTVLSYPYFRCAYRWKALHKTQRLISSLFPEMVWKILVRLSDEEIYELSTLSPNQAKQFFLDKKKNSWRWSMMLTPHQEDPKKHEAT